MFKWIAAVLGYMYFRFPGAILGFIIGTLIDNWMRGSGGAFKQMFGQQEEQKVSPGDFELNLLSLCSLVIKADGQVSQSEMDYVRSYFVQAYGKERANATFRTFNANIAHLSLTGPNSMPSISSISSRVNSFISASVLP